MKALSGFYYVKPHSSDKTIECRARGRLKKENIKPVVGDRVVVQGISPTTGVIEKVMTRKNYLIRPSVANIEQLVLVFAAQSPNPDLLLMDRLTVIGKKNGLEVLICISKIDLDEQGTLSSVKNRFKGTTYGIIGISNKTDHGLQQLKEQLKNKISTLSGPSGVGKSTLINHLNPKYKLAVSEVSEKTKRGKHTTTYCELLEVMEDSYVVDTPGFTSLELNGISTKELGDYFPEFEEFKCRYTSCIHENEDECGIKDAVTSGKIVEERYRNYLLLLKEIRENEVKY